METQVSASEPETANKRTKKETPPYRTRLPPTLLFLSSFPNFQEIFFIFSPKGHFFPNKFVSLHLLSAHDGCDVHRDVRSRWAEHYILKGVTDALFLDIRTTTIEM